MNLAENPANLPVLQPNLPAAEPNLQQENVNNGNTVRPAKRVRTLRANLQPNIDHGLVTMAHRTAYQTELAARNEKFESGLHCVSGSSLLLVVFPTGGLQHTHIVASCHGSPICCSQALCGTLLRSISRQTDSYPGIALTAGVDRSLVYNNTQPTVYQSRQSLAHARPIWGSVANTKFFK